MPKIKVLEKFSIGNEAFYEGDVRTVSDEIAQTACGAGWAEDVDGKIKTGERDPSAKKLSVDKLTHPVGVKSPK